jgi:hypothetical protein
MLASCRTVATWGKLERETAFSARAASRKIAAMKRRREFMPQ